MGLAIFKWLQIHLGIDTVKPDVHVKNFVKGCIERMPKDEEAVEAVERVAQEMSIPASSLDWAIWQYQREKSIQERRKLMVNKRRPKAKSSQLLREEDRDE